SSASRASTSAPTACPARIRAPTCARSPNDAPRRPRSTTPTAPPTVRSRFRGRGRRSRTSNSIPGSSTTSLTSIRRRPCSARRPTCRSGSPRSASPGSCKPKVRSPGPVPPRPPASRSRWAPSGPRPSRTSVPRRRTRVWYQLYVMKEREISYGLVDRAADAGFDTLFFTVDTPIAGNRMRDDRNGFSIPPQLTPKTILDAIPRPWWWWDFLTTPPLEFASLKSTGGTVGQLLDSAMDPSIDYDDLAEIRERWPGKIAIKGVQNVSDARKLV